MGNGRGMGPGCGPGVGEPETEVLQDPADDKGVVDKRDNSHGSVAFRTYKGIRLVDFSDQS